MTQTPDLFGGGKSAADSSSGKPNGAEILASLVGEGKPFKTIEDLAVSKATADAFIETLKGENKEMRDTLKSAEVGQQTNELLKTMMAKLDKASGNDGESGNQSGSASAALTKEDIVKLVQSQVSDEQRQREKLSNRLRVTSELTKMFSGDEAKAKAHIASRALELGLDSKDLASMAEEKPQVLLTLMGARTGNSKSGSSPLPLDLSRDGGNMPPAGGGDGVTRNYAYYKDLRKKLGAKYYEPHIQQQLIKDRKALGKDFFDKP